NPRGVRGDTLAGSDWADNVPSDTIASIQAAVPTMITRERIHAPHGRVDPLRAAGVRVADLGTPAGSVRAYQALSDPSHPFEVAPEDIFPLSEPPNTIVNTEVYSDDPSHVRAARFLQQTAATHLLAPPIPKLANPGPSAPEPKPERKLE